MDIQGAEAHSTISKPTNCRRQAMAEMQQVVPLHTINRFPREDDLHIREKYAITSLRIYRKVVGCSAGYPSVLQFIPIPQVTRWCILVGYLTTLSSRYARPTWLIASEGEQTSMISKASSSKVCANEHQPDWQVSIAAQEKKATSMISKNSSEYESTCRLCMLHVSDKATNWSVHHPRLNMKTRDQGRRHIKHINMAAQQHRNESKPVGKQAKEQPIAKHPVK